MAFWDNWFKVSCSRCAQMFKKDELIALDDGRSVCATCNEALEVEAKERAAELELRRAEEEAMREALLNRTYK